MTETSNYINPISWLKETYIKKRKNNDEFIDDKMLAFLQQWVLKAKQSAKILTREELTKFIEKNPELKEKINESLLAESEFVSTAMKNGDIIENKDWNYEIRISDANYEKYWEILNTFLEKYIWVDYIQWKLKWKEWQPKWHTFSLKKDEQNNLHVADMKLIF